MPKMPEPRPWWHAPTNELGVPVPLRVVLARTDQVAVALIGAIAYASGVSLTLDVRIRPTAGNGTDVFNDPLDPFGHLMMRTHQTGELPPELLRFGVQFADGRKATTVGAELRWGWPGSEEEVEPHGPVLSAGGGGGGGEQWTTEYWLWPLPPPGRLTFAVQWPSKGIELTMRDVDAGIVIDAGKQAETLWPDTGRGQGSIRTSQIMLGEARDEEELP
jgi:hypothetical protein